MNEHTWYDVFLENLHEKYPKKTQLVEEIINLLCIEREAVYRRLRKEVVFPVHEIVKIATAWNISLDEVTGINSGIVPFKLVPINYINPSKNEMIFLQQRIRALEQFITYKNSEHMEVGNKLPRPISTGFPILYKLKIFNWDYLYNRDETNNCFSEVIIPEEISQGVQAFSENVKKIDFTHFILDQKVIEFITRYVQYYHTILLITKEEKELIKEELHALLDYLTEIANKGYYPETQKKVNIYISQIHNNTNYNYYYSDGTKSCSVHAFGKYDLCSYDQELVFNFRNWMNLKKRASIQISEVNERSRIEFFSKQRLIIDAL
jgi:hypothetical protein